MFKILTDAVENALDVVSAPFEGEVPTKRQVAKLIADGMTVVAISQATGFAVEVIEKLLEDE
jgi:hypothetical protein